MSSKPFGLAMSPAILTLLLEKQATKADKPAYLRIYEDRRQRDNRKRDTNLRWFPDSRYAYWEIYWKTGEKVIAWWLQDLYQKGAYSSCCDCTYAIREGGRSFLYLRIPAWRYKIIYRWRQQLGLSCRQMDYRHIDPREGECIQFQEEREEREL